MAGKSISHDFSIFLEDIVQRILKEFHSHAADYYQNTETVNLANVSKSVLMLTNNEIESLCSQLSKIENITFLNVALSQTWLEYTNHLAKVNYPLKIANELSYRIDRIASPFPLNNCFDFYESLKKFEDYEILIYNAVVDRAVLLFLSLDGRSNHKNDLKLSFCSAMAKYMHMKNGSFSNNLRLLLKSHYDVFGLYDCHFSNHELSFVNHNQIGFEDFIYDNIREIARLELETELICNGVHPKISKRRAENETRFIFFRDDNELLQSYKSFLKLYPFPRDFMDDIFVRIGDGADISRRTADYSKP